MTCSLRPFLFIFFLLWLEKAILPHNFSFHIRTEINAYILLLFWNFIFPKKKFFPEIFSQQLVDIFDSRALLKSEK